MSAASKAATAVLADDHEIVRQGLAAICRNCFGMQVIGECGDGFTAIQLIRALQPDVAILDLCMPRLDGLEVLRRLRKDGLRSRFLVLSVSCDRTAVVEALRAGAHGFLSKDRSARELKEAIDVILEGRVHVPADIDASQLVAALVPDRPPEPIASLSLREREVFSMMSQGKRTREIARCLDISPRTVEAHRASLMRKLATQDRFSLVGLAVPREPSATGQPGVRSRLRAAVRRFYRGRPSPEPARS